MSSGWILIHRQIWDNEYLWDDRPFTRGQAWIDLIMLVNSEDKYSQKHNMTVRRGQHITSMRKLGARWGWSRHKIADFLNSLLSAGMAKIESDTKKTVVTIENYDFFQNPQNKKGHRRDTKGTQKDTNKESKEHKEDISCRNSPDGEVGDDRSDFEKKALLAAEYMSKRILRNTPNFPPLSEGKREATVRRWASDIEKLLRIDKVGFETFKAVLQFSQNDPFWRTNILSGKKLREQFPALLVKMGGDSNDQQD